MVLFWVTKHQNDKLNVGRGSQIGGFAISRIGKTACAIAIQDKLVRDIEPRWQPAHHLPLYRIAHDGEGFCVAEKILYLVSLTGRVERMEGQPGMKKGKVGAKVCDRLVDLNSDPITRPRTRSGQQCPRENKSASQSW